MRGLVQAGRAPRTIVLENVYGCLTSHGGKDFAAIASALSESDTNLEPRLSTPSHFVPQSRPRVFFIAVRKGARRSRVLLVAEAPSRWHPAALIKAHAGMTPQGEDETGSGGISHSRLRETRLLRTSSKTSPTGVKWHTAADTQYLLDLMSPLIAKRWPRP